MTKEKKVKPIIITIREDAKPVELEMANPKIMFMKTLASWPWASDKAHNLK